MQFRFRSDIKIHQFEDLGIVIDKDKENCYVVNKTAIWLLSMMSEFISLEDLSALAQEKYARVSTDHVFTEIQEIINYLWEKNMIEVRGKSSSAPLY